MSDSIATQSIGRFTDAVAGDAPTPGGGAVAGAVAALGAALVGMAGRYAARQAGEPSAFDALVHRADELRARAGELADADAAAYGRYVEATRNREDPEARRRAIRTALDAAADVPFDLGGVAAEIAGAGERLATSGNPRLRPDACTAALLASAVATSTAILVQDNLHDHPDDPRVARAIEHAREAVGAAERALAAHGPLLDGVRA